VKGNIGINDQADWIAQDNLCTHWSHKPA
jgi:hypothetical protein